MIYKLATIRSNQEGFERLAQLWSEAARLFSTRLELDLSECNFFDANMAAPLGAVLALIADKFNRIEIVRVPGPIEIMMRRNLFLADFGYAPLESGGTIMPYRRFQLTDVALFAEYLRGNLRGKGFPQINEGAGKVFQQSVLEVFQNSVTHSDSRLGIFVCGQFYPHEQRLNIAISDAGVGIRDKVRQYLRKSEMSSQEAIRWALQGGNTTRTGPRPGGVGLKFLHDFVVRNRGKIQIISDDGFYEYGTGYDTLKACLPGTTVNLEINTGDTNSYRLNSGISPKSIF